MVAPVRCATPGTEVVCARWSPCSAKSMIQSASTPPPSPPMARMAILIGRTLAALMVGSVTSADGERAAVQAPLQRPDDEAAHARQEPVPAGWIVDDRGAVERRAQHRRVRDLAAQAEADARVDHLGDR